MPAAQNFFRSYPKLAGMTGTAATEGSEFESIYKLPVAVVPPNRSVARTDYSDVVFRQESGKWRAVTQEVQRMHKKGRPVLVGTTSVEKSEHLASLLGEQGIPYRVLNAKPENVEREAEIVAQSGRRGAVTIATNMAGRGTDILLGGNAGMCRGLGFVVLRGREDVGVAYTSPGEPCCCRREHRWCVCNWAGANGSQQFGPLFLPSCTINLVSPPCMQSSWRD